MTYPHCNGGPCDQGRKPCPLGAACHTPEFADFEAAWEAEFEEEISRLDREGRALTRWFFGSLAVIALAMFLAAFA